MSDAQGFAHAVAHLRPYLLRFARLQLRDDASAEDVVSETLVAALGKPQSFAGQSQLRTWLVGILKHKVIDLIRVRAREVRVDDVAEEEAGADVLDDLIFKADGHFAQEPSDWGNPEQDLRSQQFMRVMDACIEKLPAAAGRAFLMREWLELSSDEVCKELNVTATNLYVQLHRARLRLRECLELNWFGHTP